MYYSYPRIQLIAVYRKPILDLSVVAFTPLCLNHLKALTWYVQLYTLTLSKTCIYPIPNSPGYQNITCTMISADYGLERFTLKFSNVKENSSWWMTVTCTGLPQPCSGGHSVEFSGNPSYHGRTHYHWQVWSPAWVSGKRGCPRTGWREGQWECSVLESQITGIRQIIHQNKLHAIATQSLDKNANRQSVDTT